MTETTRQPRVESGLSMDEKTKRLLRIALKDPEHLKRWLQETGRRWMVLDSVDLVDALPWPDGVDALIQILACYRDHRQGRSSGRTEKMKDPILGRQVEVPIMKTDVLEIEEMDRAIRHLIRQASEKDPTWKLENPPL